MSLTEIIFAVICFAAIWSLMLWQMWRDDESTREFLREIRVARMKRRIDVFCVKRRRA